MQDIIKKLSRGENVTLPTQEFKDIRQGLNNIALNFKISAVVGKFHVILKRI